MPPSIDEGLSYFADAVADRVRAGTPVSVTTHIDCDGLASGGILARALARAGASFTVSAVKELGEEAVSSLKSGPGRFHIIADLGAGMAGRLGERLGDDWVVLDHHQIPEGEMDDERVVNAWRFGMDGGRDVCGGGMSYLAAEAADPRNADLAAVAVVSALGDRQDSGERGALVGRNKAIQEAAVSRGLLEVDMDLRLVGRQTRPLPDSLAATSRPFIAGLTWNRGACTALLTSAGIPLKEGGRWRVAADLSEEEKRMLVEAVARYAAGAPAGGGAGREGGGPGGRGPDGRGPEKSRAEAAADDIVGYTYTLSAEDERGFLRDAREFSTMLNSCGRIGRSGVGICICMGDRGGALREGEAALAEYRGRIREQMDRIASERGRTQRGRRVVTVNASGVVPETMAGTIASLLAGSPRNAGMIVVLTADGGGDGTAKVSARAAPEGPGPVNLGRLMSEAGEAFGGAGGGHAGAAGARVARDKLDGFLDRLESDVSRVHGDDSAA